MRNCGSPRPRARLSPGWESRKSGAQPRTGSMSTSDGKSGHGHARSGGDYDEVPDRGVSPGGRGHGGRPGAAAAAAGRSVDGGNLMKYVILLLLVGLAVLVARRYIRRDDP